MAKNSDVKKAFIKAGLAGQGCDFSNLTAYGGARLGGKPPGVFATVIAGAAEGAQHAKIFTSNSLPEILENTVRHVYKLASEADGSTGMAVALGEIEGFTGVVVEYLDRAPALSRFVAIRRAVMDQGECVATAKSKTFAKRIANALNKHIPNREGV